MARGFAAMDKAKLRAASSKGGKISQARNGHRWDKEEARMAGLKGGAKTAQNHEHMVSAGRKGGLAKKAS
jgi:uncharacterized protein